MATVPALLLVLLLVHTTCSYDLMLNVVDHVENVMGEIANVFSSPRETVIRDDISCDVRCKTSLLDEYLDSDREREKCCTCKSYPKWEGQEENLDIEYLSVLGVSVVVPEEAVKNETNYKIEVLDGEMGEIPSNICDWDKRGAIKTRYIDSFRAFKVFWNKIVKIDFTRNRIRQVVDLTCLTSLDTLELGFNSITHLNNDTFHTLTHLRVLNLERNLIMTMDPSVLTSPKLHLTDVNLRNNSLVQLDVTNCMSLYPFCYIDYSGNGLNELTNVLNHTLDTTMTYGPGYVNLQNTQLTTFPDLTNLLHLDSIAQLGRILEFGFDLTDVPIICDGRIEPYLELALQIEDSFWRNYLDVKCAAPEALAGRMIKDIELDELVTNDFCYQDCKCQCQPSKNEFHVNCSGLGITDMSIGEIPHPAYCDKISLNLANNDIKYVENIVNLDKVTALNLSNNDIIGISPEVTIRLDNFTMFDLTNNTNLKMLPEQFRYLNSCKVHFDNIINIDCYSTWISEWSQKSRCDGQMEDVLFQVPRYGLMPVTEFNKDMLECENNDNEYTKEAVILAISTLVIVIIAYITHQLRYEIMITLLRLRRAKKNEVVPSFAYDAFFSFDEENSDLRIWVNSELIPQLEDRGYKNFLSYRDIDFGAVRDNMTIDALNRTRNFVLILSQSYFFEQEEIRWRDREWKHGWHMFKSNKFKNIVLVNFDHVSSFDVDHPQIKAFLRVGGQVSFTNHNRDIIEQISRKLGPPLVEDTQTNKSCVNKKAMFDVNKLFLVDNPSIWTSFVPPPTIKSKEYEENATEETGVTKNIFDILDKNRVREQSKPVFRFQKYS